MRNTPDDWDQYYYLCPDCGKKYHASGETVCDCVLCDVCGQWFPPLDMANEECCKSCQEEYDQANTTKKQYVVIGGILFEGIQELQPLLV